MEDGFAAVQEILLGITIGFAQATRWVEFLAGQSGEKNSFCREKLGTFFVAWFVLTEIMRVPERQWQSYRTQSWFTFFPTILANCPTHDLLGLKKGSGVQHRLLEAMVFGTEPCSMT